MKKIWFISGKFAYWLSLPLLYVYFRMTKRTRVLVAVGDNVLVVKAWLGSGRWGLPGGGLHIGEKPAAGAVRELAEETGIEVNASKLQYLFSKISENKHGPRYLYHAFLLKLAKPPAISKQELEITHAEWKNWRELAGDPRTDKDVKDILSAFFQG